MHTETPNRPYVVYKLYTDDCDLLYVGSTCAEALRARLWAHQHKQPWAKQIAWIETKEYNNRSAARIVEYTTIDAECPRYNTYGVEDRFRTT